MQALESWVSSFATDSGARDCPAKMLDVTGNSPKR
jgi:hypothetical protein